MTRTKKKTPDKLAVMEYRNALAELQYAQKRLREYHEKYEDIGKELFKEDVLVLFEKNPNLKVFGWRQYTQFFNDGDPCYFSAHTDEPRINNMDYYRGEEIDEEIDGMPDLTEKEMDQLQDVVAEFLNAYNDDSLEEWFGDHVEVTVSRDGITTTTYDSHS